MCLFLVLQDEMKNDEAVVSDMKAGLWRRSICEDLVRDRLSSSKSTPLINLRWACLFRRGESLLRLTEWLQNQPDPRTVVVKLCHGDLADFETPLD